MTFNQVFVRLDFHIISQDPHPAPKWQLLLTTAKIIFIELSNYFFLPFDDSFAPMIYNKSAGDFAEAVYRNVNRFYSPLLAALPKVQELNTIKFHIHYYKLLHNHLLNGHHAKNRCH